MRIAPINNNTAFKAKLPPYIRKNEKDKYYDYWPILAKNCQENGTKNELDELLTQLTNNNIDGYLALEAKTNSLDYDINFRYYTDKDKIKQSRSKDGAVEFENGEVSILRSGINKVGIYAFNGCSVIEKPTFVNFNDLTQVILTTLKKVLKTGSVYNETVFGKNPTKTSPVEQYHKKFRATI